MPVKRCVRFSHCPCLMAMDFSQILTLAREGSCLHQTKKVKRHLIFNGRVKFLFMLRRYEESTVQNMRLNLMH